MGLKILFIKETIMNREDLLLEKAGKKAQKFADDNGYGFMQHSLGNSGCENHGGKEYVVLRNTTDILSLWLVDNEDKLHLVDHKDYPDDLLAELNA
jgi:hypothetical protein